MNLAKLSVSRKFNVCSTIVLIRAALLIGKTDRALRQLGTSELWCEVDNGRGDDWMKDKAMEVSHVLLQRVKEFRTDCQLEIDQWYL